MVHQRYEMFNFAREPYFKGMEEIYINELLTSHNLEFAYE